MIIGGMGAKSQAAEPPVPQQRDWSPGEKPYPAAQGQPTPDKRLSSVRSTIRSVASKTVLTLWFPPLAVGLVAVGVAFAPLKGRAEALALSLTAGATAAYTVLTWLLVLRATQQTKKLAEQLDVHRQSLEETRRQFDAQMDVASQSTHAASAAVLEAARTRTDERAPRVVALLEAPVWPPYVQTGMHAPYAGQAGQVLSLESSSTVERDREFCLPRDENDVVWSVTRGVLINEGRGIARVHIGGVARFSEGVSALAGERKLTMPPMVGPPINQEYLLRPGDAVLFEWNAGLRVADWVRFYQEPTERDVLGPCRFVINVHGFEEDGVIDYIPIELSGQPLEPIPMKNDAWRIAEIRSIAAVAYATRRRYRNEPYDHRPLFAV